MRTEPALNPALVASGLPCEAARVQTMDDTESASHREAVGNAAFVLALRERGVRDTATLRAMERVPRERFAPARFRDHARRDVALPLPCGATMTAPTIVAAMLTALAVAPGARILEIGTGSGYVTALLVSLGGAGVRSLERYATLADHARVALGAEAVANATIEIADGLSGDAAGEGVYDRILVNGACRAMPVHLAAALGPGGRLVGALSTEAGPRLLVVERDAAGNLAHRVGKAARLAALIPGRAQIF